MSPALVSTFLPDLIECLLARGLWVRVAVGGRSMGPRLRHGDVVTVEPLAGDRARRGDLVLYRSCAGTLVLHRLVRRWRGPQGQQRIQTRGDADPRLDVSVPAARVLGRVRHIEREDRGRIDLATPLERLRAFALVATLLAGSACHYARRRLGGAWPLLGRVGST